jgi:hypothetical protein
MTTILVLVALLSLAVAAGLLVQNWRLFRDEARRSAARVEALRAAASEPPDRTSVPVPSSHDLFETGNEPAPARRRLAFPVGLAVAAAVIALLGVAATNDGSPDLAGGGSDTPMPLELVRLQHERSGDRLSISGVVRNPTSGRSIADTDVVVTAFDRAGALVTSITGPLDFRTLEPGDESAFTIALDEAAAVGRYRVSFRSDARVVPHVDRRGDAIAPATLVQKQQLTRAP